MPISVVTELRLYALCESSTWRWRSPEIDIAGFGDAEQVLFIFSGFWP
jgi:hypothetical protein